LREKGVRVQVWNTLDEYGFFAAHEYSFYVGDDRVPNVISIHAADFARPLRCKVSHLLGVHAVSHYQLKGSVEVQSLHRNAEIPIYIPLGPRRGRVAVYLEALETPVWILGPDQSDNDALYGELADAVAFWLWHASVRLHGKLKHVSLLTIELAVAEEFQGKVEESKSLPALLVESTGASALKLVFTSTVHDLVRQPDNRADRELLKSLLLALMTPNLELEHQVATLVEQIAPLGLKKKLLSFNVRADAALDERGLPLYRGVRKY